MRAEIKAEIAAVRASARPPHLGPSTGDILAQRERLAELGLDGEDEALEYAILLSREEDEARRAAENHAAGPANDHSDDEAMFQLTPAPSPPLRSSPRPIARRASATPPRGSVSSASSIAREDISASGPPSERSLGSSPSSFPRLSRAFDDAFPLIPPRPSPPVNKWPSPPVASSRAPRGWSAVVRGGRGGGVAPAATRYVAPSSAREEEEMLRRAIEMSLSDAQLE